VIISPNTVSRDILGRDKTEETEETEETEKTEETEPWEYRLDLQTSTKRYLSGFCVLSLFYAQLCSFCLHAGLPYCPNDRAPQRHIYSIPLQYLRLLID
jgi:hypothetical protein